MTVTIEEEPSTKALDLMFVFDTTGSMGDELRYLQTEFEDIAKKLLTKTQDLVLISIGMKIYM